MKDFDVKSDCFFILQIKDNYLYPTQNGDPTRKNKSDINLVGLLQLLWIAKLIDDINLSFNPPKY